MLQYFFKILKNIISIEIDKNTNHKIFKCLNLKLKIKYTYLNPAAKNKKRLQYKENVKKVAIFASFNKECEIKQNVVEYLKEIKNYVDYIIMVADNPIISSAIDKIDHIVDSYIFERHNKYDFGSYQRGFFTIKKIFDINQISHIYFMNDSVKYLNVSLKKLFDNANVNDFYGVTYHAYGYIKKGAKYSWGYSPHFQSYWLSISNKIFINKKFVQFLKKIKQEKDKKDIIYKYEEGLSKLIFNFPECKFETYYPKNDSDFEPCIYYLNSNSDFDGIRFFEKNIPYTTNRPLNLQEERK